MTSVSSCPATSPYFAKCAFNLTMVSEKNKICPLSLKQLSHISIWGGLVSLLHPGFWMHKGVPYEISPVKFQFFPLKYWLFVSISILLHCPYELSLHVDLNVENPEEALDFHTYYLCIYFIVIYVLYVLYWRLR